MSRTRNVIKNTFYGVVGKLIGLALSFISRTVFILYLGSTYLGINGLYTEILYMLSFTELGFGSALIFSMYKPVAKGDRENTLQLLSFYKKTYRLIALIILLLGIALLPFLEHIVQGADMVTLSELRLYYILFLLDSVVSYFVTYKYSYLRALQKTYITTNFDTVFNFVSSAVQIAVIIITHSFLSYLLTRIGLQILSRGVVALYLNRKFPILKDKPQIPLGKDERRSIFREVKDLSVHQFAGVAVHATDNIIISSVSGLGIVGVGLVSNYTLIINSVISFVKIFFAQTTAGFGNLSVENSYENYRKVFLEINFLSFWIYGFCSIAFFVLIPPFITLWIGSEYLIDSVSLFLIVISNYLYGQFRSYDGARSVKGNFGKDKWLAFLEAMVNLVVSIIGARVWGLVGVYVGTVASRLVLLITRPMSTYRFLFGCSPLEYYVSMTVYCIATVFSGAVTWFITKGLLAEVTILNFAYATGLVAVIPNLLFLILFARTKEFRALLMRVRSIIAKK